MSYRLGGIDGVSVEAAKWVEALEKLGLAVHTVAGGGTSDRRVAGLDLWDAGPPDTSALEKALRGADLVVAENICSLPINRAASEAVASALRGRPAVLHHHDLPWQRPGLGDTVPDDPAWVHVTVNEHSREELAQRGIEAVTLYNHFDPDPPPGDGALTRHALDVGTGTRIVMQPTRAIGRKNIAAGLRLAESLEAFFWLTGKAEEGYDRELQRLLGRARVPTVHRPAPIDMAGAYAAADVVVLPSTWEGFGNPAVEAGLHGRPLVIGPYPVADELSALGFRWFGLDETDRLRTWLADPDPALIEANREVVRHHLNLSELPQKIARILEGIRPGDQ